MMTSSARAYSDLPIPPGEILKEELEVRGMTQKELAARLGRPEQTISEIVRAKKAITPETALGLGMVLGIDPQFWANLEADYRMTLARQREEEMLAANVRWLNEYPVGEMLKRGWIRAGRDKQSRLRALMDFLGVAVAEPQAVQQAVGFRITEAAQRKASLGALAVWLRKGELDAQDMDTADYDPRAFAQALSDIRGMTTQPPEQFVPAMTELCARAGVAFCMVRELPKSGANGVARLLPGRKALLQMSIRNKWADIFWFTFFHEACHLLKHRTQRRILIDGLGADPESAGIETEADRFAEDLLIPPQAWDVFCTEGHFTPSAIRTFARSVEIAPFIVVGRLQKKRLIRYNQLATLKRRYEWINETDG